jgi:M6 family metalloprotease-like protein
MRNLFLFTLIVLIFSFSASATYNPPEGYDEELPGSILSSSQRGGLHISSWGNFNIFVVFVKMKDDVSTRANGWPVDQTPDWLFHFVDNVPNSNGNFDYNNLSQYFWEMSNGNYQVIGDVYPEVYISNKNENEYTNLEELNEEVLMSVDPTTDFTLYDNWHKDSNYNHTKVADGKVDLVLIIYRELSKSLMGFTGSARLYLPNDLDCDGVTIKKGWPDWPEGSGIQQKGAIWGLDFTKYVAAHEIGHYLFGSGHLGSVPRLAIMHDGPAWNAGRGMCSWERERLGWIDYNEIQTTGSINITLSDYMTTGDVVKINTGYSGEYFLLENRQVISIHDQAKDKGLYVFHVKNGHYSMANMDVECADGNWDFSYNSSTEKLSRTNPNVNGKDEVKFYTYHSGDKIMCLKPYYPDNDVWGDGEDAFSLDFNPVFTPWSNPRSSNSGGLDFSIEVFNENNGLVQANVNFSSPEEHAPAKPLDLELTIQNNHPHITWYANSEPDFSHYEIWKRRSSGSWYFVTTTTNNYYTDGVESTGRSKLYTYVHYKVKAVDNSGKESQFSNEVKTKVKEMECLDKFTSNFVDKTITEYSLKQNFPNPFNPKTKITFEVPEFTKVTLTVYDIRGRVVSSLANDYFDKGSYTVDLKAK